MRSAKAPTMSAGVIAAKVSWKAMKASSGIATPLVKVSAVESVRDAGQERLREAADEGAEAARSGREGERVAVDDPQDRHEAEDGEDLRQQRQHVLGAHEAAVEQGEARDRHEDDEDRRDEHPGGVALVDRGGAAAAASAAGRGGVLRQGGIEGEQAQRRSSEGSHEQETEFIGFRLRKTWRKERGIRGRRHRSRRCGCEPPFRAT